jgi:hypothetical protein
MISESIPHMGAWCSIHSFKSQRSFFVFKRILKSDLRSAIEAALDCICSCHFLRGELTYNSQQDRQPTH